MCWYCAGHVDVASQVSLMPHPALTYICDHKLWLKSSLKAWYCHESALLQSGHHIRKMALYVTVENFYEVEPGSWCNILYCRHLVDVSAFVTFITYSLWWLLHSPRTWSDHKFSMLFICLLSMSWKHASYGLPWLLLAVQITCWWVSFFLQTQHTYLHTLWNKAFL